MTNTPDPSVTERVAQCLPDDIDVFRLIRRAGRKDADKARAVSAMIEDVREALLTRAALTSMPKPALEEENARLRAWVEAEMARAKDDRQQARLTGEAYDLGEAQGKMLLLMELRAALSPRKEDQQ